MDALLLKVSLLLSAGLLAARLLRRAPAVTRHRLWSLVFTAALALPLLASVLPALYIPLPRAWGSVEPLRPAPVTFADSAGTGGPLAADRTDETIADGRLIARVQPRVETEPGRSLPLVTAPPTPAALLLGAWLAGTAATVVAVLLSLLRVRRLTRVAEELDDERWRCAADTLGGRLGLRRPARLLVSPDVDTPMAGGVWRPVIFLPASARLWSDDRRDVVLAHEIAHLAGRDPLRHVVARLAVAVYWFHPLSWIAAREATAAREQACDEAVLALGTRPSAYARVLLDLAESLHPSAPALGALPMVERSLLETRLMAILNDARPVRRQRGLLPVAGMILLTLSVAAAQPAVPAPAPTVTSAAVPPAGAEPAPATSVAVTPVSPHVAVETVAAATAQTAVDPDSGCWLDASDSISFSGNISSDAGGTVVHEQIGTRGADRIIRKRFGDARLCMLAEGAGDSSGARTERPSEWLGRARRVVMEARRGTVIHRLEVERLAGGQRTSWRVGQAARDFDGAAEQWRDRMLAALDTTWELAILRGEVSSLRGQISSIRGQESSLRGQISSLRGEVSSMQGRISSIRGEESSLRGRISSIRGHVSSLQGAISSERGAISSLNASRYRADDADRTRIATRIGQHEAEIDRIEREIRDYGADARIAAVEREIDGLDAAGKAAAIYDEIRAFDLEGKVAAVERRIDGLDVEGKVAAIERQIKALDADRRGRELEDRRDRELRQFDAAMKAVR